jgi:hypothetical protein
MTGTAANEEFFLGIKEGEEKVIHIYGEAFVITKATEADIERISSGYFCLD